MSGHIVGVCQLLMIFGGKVGNQSIGKPVIIDLSSTGIYHKCTEPHPFRLTASTIG